MCCNELSDSSNNRATLNGSCLCASCSDCCGCFLWHTTKSKQQATNNSNSSNHPATKPVRLRCINFKLKRPMVKCRRAPPVTAMPVWGHAQARGRAAHLHLCTCASSIPSGRTRITQPLPLLAQAREAGRIAATMSEGCQPARQS